MAPYPNPNQTPALYVEMHTPYGRHTTEFRFQEGASSADAITVAQAFCNAVKDLVASNCIFDKARWRGAGSPLSFPVGWTPITGTNGTALAERHRANFISFTGRSNGGRRVRVTVFGVPVDQNESNFRYTSAEAGYQGDAITALTSGTEAVRAIDGSIPQWNPYVNFGVNAYFQRKARRG